MNKQKKCVVLTTINPAVDNAIAQFASLKNFDLIIAGDKKTPSYDLDCVYFSISEQQKYFPTFFDLIPFNHYSRKNFGYLYAIREGYSVIAESDDDNYYYDQWFVLPPENTKHQTIVEPKYPNIYSAFAKEHIWPRGYPLDLILNHKEVKSIAQQSNVLIWQGLVDGDTDVDAIYRLVIGKEIIFDKNKIIVLDKGVISPFNSQNTLWHKKAFYLMYLPISVTFRFTDILRSYVAQFGLWAIGGRLGFMSPNAEQKRNAHNLLKDFADEVSVYNSFYQVMDVLQRCNLNGEPEDLFIMYSELLKIGVVKENELVAVREWLNLYNQFEKK